MKHSKKLNVEAILFKGGEEIRPEKILILDKNVIGNLTLCPLCGINYSALGHCIYCEIREDFKKRKKRYPTKKEFELELKEWGI